jgi:hypothetical protein
MGGAGVAGAASTSTATPTHSITCTTAEAFAAKIAAREAKVPSILAKAQAHETKATSNGHAKMASRIQQRIKRIGQLQARGERIEQRVEAKCGSSTSSSASTSGSTTAS